MRRDRLDRGDQVDDAGGDGARRACRRCSGAQPSLPWAMVMPPHSLIALRPSDPSLPVPDRTMPMAFSRSSVARELKKLSIGRCSRGASHRGHADAQAALGEADDGMRRRDVDGVGRDRLVVLGLDHRHGGPAGEDLGQHAAPPDRQVQQHDEGHAAVGGHGVEEAMEGVEAASRRADADNTNGRPGAGLGAGPRIGASVGPRAVLGGGRRHRTEGPKDRSGSIKRLRRSIARGRETE